MDIYIKLFLASLLSVAITVIFYLLDKKTSFNKLSFWTKQIIIGIIFGGASICGTEFGVDIGGATANARDAAPLCAGLIFGAPAGIIAGVIGGVERWFAVLWGNGMYSRVACSVSTVLSGIYAALLRKYMLDDKRPSWGFGLATGIVMEVLHMTILFLTHLSDAEAAFEIVKICTLPMVWCNAISVMLALIAVSICSHEKLFGKEQHKTLAHIVRVRLLICIVIAYIVTSSFSFALQSGIADNNVTRLLDISNQNIVTDILSVSDKRIMEIAHAVAKEVSPDTDNSQLQALAEKYNVQEIDIVNENGIITACTDSEIVGYDMASGEQSREFLILNDAATEYVQQCQPMSFDKTTLRKYAGIKLSRGFVQVAYDAQHFQDSLSSSVADVTKHRAVGETGYIVILDQNGEIVSDIASHTAKHNTIKDILFEGNYKQDENFATNLYKEDVICRYTISEGYYILSVLPIREAYYMRDIANYINSYMEILVFAALYALIYFILKKRVVESMQSVNTSLGKITQGELDVKIDVRSSAEFLNLSDDINATVDTLKRYIAEASARIDKELEFARQIQHSALPNIFPAYPTRTDFDIFASMHTAKEVGGDFYDFYFVDENKFAILIADVSGKGVPAAMFMMTAKTLIKNFAERGLNAAEVLSMANDSLCENNDAGMFVTAWLGIIDLTTGNIEYANAGHNPPIIKRADESCEYVTERSGLVLAGMPGMKYKPKSCKLNEGDGIYLYTDGITEAINEAEELYGEDRLIKFIKNSNNPTPIELCESIKADVDSFAGTKEQFDDMTMLAFKFIGGNK